MKGKAVKKVNKALPKTPTKKLEVVRTWVNSLKGKGKGAYMSSIEASNFCRNKRSCLPEVIKVMLFPMSCQGRKI